MNKLLFLIVILGFNANLYADRESTVSGGERTPEQRYAACMAVWLEDEDQDFDEADAYCSKYLDGLSAEEIDEIKEEVESDLFAGDGRGISLSVINGGTPGQPIDLPKRPVVYSTINPGNGNEQGVGPGIEPVFYVSTEECDRGGTVGLICSYNENQELVASTESNLSNAINLLKNAGLEVTTEGVLVAGGIVGTTALILKYGRSLNPLGAFALGLGIAPAAASDYCSMYSSESGLDYFVNELSNELQLQELRSCPQLSVRVLNLATQVSEYN